MSPRAGRGFKVRDTWTLVVACKRVQHEGKKTQAPEGRFTVGEGSATYYCCPVPREKSRSGSPRLPTCASLCIHYSVTLDAGSH